MKQKANKNPDYSNTDGSMRDTDTQGSTCVYVWEVTRDGVDCLVQLLQQFLRSVGGVDVDERENGKYEQNDAYSGGVDPNRRIRQ